MHIFTPLEQFEIKVLTSLSFFGLFDISFTNITFYLLLFTICLCFIFYFGLFKLSVLPSKLQLLLEFFYQFIFEMLLQQAGAKAQKYFPILFSVFFFILSSNLIGLMPFGVTVTAQLINTFALAFSFNVGFIILGFSLHGFQFLQLFVPKEAPKVLVPLIVVIEVVSYLIRTFSLSLRLFANMMAGHTLLHILASFVVKFIKAGFLLVSLLPFILVLMVTVLEFGIAFLQAYVFTILLCIYLNDSLHPGH